MSGGFGAREAANGIWAVETMDVDDTCLSLTYKTRYLEP
jgi:hypothetical protein